MQIDTQPFIPSITSSCPQTPSSPASASSVHSSNTSSYRSLPPVFFFDYVTPPNSPPKEIQTPQGLNTSGIPLTPQERDSLNTLLGTTIPISKRDGRTTPDFDLPFQLHDIVAKDFLKNLQDKIIQHFPQNSVEEGRITGSGANSILFGSDHNDIDLTFYCHHYGIPPFYFFQNLKNCFLQALVEQLPDSARRQMKDSILGTDSPIPSDQWFCSVLEKYYLTNLKHVNEPHNNKDWYIIAVGSLEIKFVLQIPREWDFSAKSFQVSVPCDTSITPKKYCLYGDYEKARRHVEEGILTTSTPEDIDFGLQRLFSNLSWSKSCSKKVLETFVANYRPAPPRFFNLPQLIESVLDNHSTYDNHVETIADILTILSKLSNEKDVFLESLSHLLEWHKKHKTSTPNLLNKLEKFFPNIRKKGQPELYRSLLTRFLDTNKALATQNLIKIKKEGLAVIAHLSAELWQTFITTIATHPALSADKKLEILAYLSPDKAQTEHHKYFSIADAFFKSLPHQDTQLLIPTLINSDNPTLAQQGRKILLASLHDDLSTNMSTILTAAKGYLCEGAENAHLKGLLTYLPNYFCDVNTPQQWLELLEFYDQLPPAIVSSDNSKKLEGSLEQFISSLATTENLDTLTIYLLSSQRYNHFKALLPSYLRASQTCSTKTEKTNLLTIMNGCLNHGLLPEAERVLKNLSSQSFATTPTAYDKLCSKLIIELIATSDAANFDLAYNLINNAIKRPSFGTIKAVSEKSEALYSIITKLLMIDMLTEAEHILYAHPLHNILSSDSSKFLASKLSLEQKRVAQADTMEAFLLVTEALAKIAVPSDWSPELTDTFLLKLKSLDLSKSTSEDKKKLWDILLKIKKPSKETLSTIESLFCDLATTPTNISNYFRQLASSKLFHSSKLISILINSTPLTEAHYQLLTSMPLTQWAKNKKLSPKLLNDITGTLINSTRQQDLLTAAHLYISLPTEERKSCQKHLKHLIEVITTYESTEAITLSYKLIEASIKEQVLSKSHFKTLIENLTSNPQPAMAIQAPVLFQLALDHQLLQGEEIFKLSAHWMVTNLERLHETASKEYYLSMIAYINIALKHHPHPPIKLFTDLLIVEPLNSLCSSPPLYSCAANFFSRLGQLLPLINIEYLEKSTSEKLVTTLLEQLPTINTPSDFEAFLDLYQCLLHSPIDFVLDDHPELIEKAYHAAINLKAKNIEDYTVIQKYKKTSLWSEIPLSRQLELEFKVFLTIAETSPLSEDLIYTVINTFSHYQEHISFDDSLAIETSSWGSCYTLINTLFMQCNTPQHLLRCLHLQDFMVKFLDFLNLRRHLIEAKGSDEPIDLNKITQSKIDYITMYSASFQQSLKLAQPLLPKTSSRAEEDCSYYLFIALMSWRNTELSCQRLSLQNAIPENYTDQGIEMFEKILQSFRIFFGEKPSSSRLKQYRKLWTSDITSVPCPILTQLSSTEGLKSPYRKLSEICQTTFFTSDYKAVYQKHLQEVAEEGPSPSTTKKTIQDHPSQVKQGKKRPRRRRR
ncbi:MAG: hypothetical protein ACQEP8_02350 [Chlamydiota bacterium]